MSLQRLLENSGITSEQLDYLVHDAADRVASRVNNEGLSEQIRFATQNGVTEEEIAAEFGISLDDEGDAEPLSALNGIGQTIEIDNPIKLVRPLGGMPRGTRLIVRDVGLAGKAPNQSKELICERESDGSRHFLEPKDVALSDDSETAECPTCGKSLNLVESVQREYVNKDDGESMYALGHYSVDGFVSDRVDKPCDGRFDLLDDSDSCYACDTKL